MEKKMEKYLGDKLVEGKALELKLKQEYDKQLSKNAMLYILYKLLDYKSDGLIENRDFHLTSKSILSEDIYEFIKSLSDSECIKNLYENNGQLIYHMVLLDNNSLLLIYNSKYFTLSGFKVYSFKKVSFEQTGLNSFKIDIELNSEKKNSVKTFNFNDLMNHKNIINKDIREVLVPINLEEAVIRYYNNKSTNKQFQLK